MAERRQRGLLFDDVLPQARRTVESLLSLEPQEDVSATQQAIEAALGFVPGIGQAMALRDIERARRAGDPAGAALAATEFIPFGRAISAMRRAPTMGIAKYDPRFDKRVKEQERLQALTPIVESKGTVNPPEISIADLEGRPFITSMSDRTAAGGILRGINDVQFNMPVELRGGQDFMFENPKMVWASGRGPTKQIRELAEQVKVITGQDPLYIPWRMAPTGGDFASMTGETMLSYADAAMSKNTKKALDAEIKKLIPNWSGVGSEKSIQQFRGAKDSVRKKVKKMLDVNFREQGGLGIGEARLAVTDPRQYTAPDTGIQNVGVIRAGAPLITQSGHPSYPYGVQGEGLGRIKEDVRIYQLLKEVAEARGIADPRNPSQRDIRSLQMKPYYGRITAEELKKLGL
ncbi:MAG: hypothetical protein ACO3LD_02755 [Luminiphilus sp.]